jgi:hypothetical protein
MNALLLWPRQRSLFQLQGLTADKNHWWGATQNGTARCTTLVLFARKPLLPASPLAAFLYGG